MRVRALLLIALSISVWACRSAPIRDVEGARLTAARGSVALSDVDEAIWRAGRKLGWQMEILSEGRLRGTLHRTRYIAVVFVTHDGRHFDIRYEDSEHLRHVGDEIHPNYNVWVERLAAMIQREPILPAPSRAD